MMRADTVAPGKGRMKREMRKENVLRQLNPIPIPPRALCKSLSENEQGNERL